MQPALGRVPVPRLWPLRPADLLGLFAGAGLLVVGMWVRHGGFDQLSTMAGTLTAAGQLTALVGTYLALVQLVLMSRSPWLDQLFGMERISVWHRWIGSASCGSCSGTPSSRRWAMPWGVIAGS